MQHKESNHPQGSKRMIELQAIFPGISMADGFEYATIYILLTKKANVIRRGMQAFQKRDKNLKDEIITIRNEKTWVAKMVKCYRWSVCSIDKKKSTIYTSAS